MLCSAERPLKSSAGMLTSCRLCKPRLHVKSHGPQLTGCGGRCDSLSSDDGVLTQATEASRICITCRSSRLRKLVHSLRGWGAGALKLSHCKCSCPRRQTEAAYDNSNRLLLWHAIALRSSKEGA